MFLYRFICNFIALYLFTSSPVYPSIYISLQDLSVYTSIHMAVYLNDYRIGYRTTLAPHQPHIFPKCVVKPAHVPTIYIIHPGHTIHTLLSSSSLNRLLISPNWANKLRGCQSEWGRRKGLWVFLPASENQIKNNVVFIDKIGGFIGHKNNLLQNIILRLFCQYISCD